MTRAALILAISLVAAAPAAAATLPYNADMVLTAGPDGRPMFRPADGIDLYPGKYAATIRPKRRPCEPLPVCLHGLTYAALPLSLAAYAVPQTHTAPVWQSAWTVHTPHRGHSTGGGATGDWDKPPAPVSLPASGVLLLCAAAALAFFKRKPA